LSYSQHDEERWICGNVSEAPGVLLDIGAFDGRTFSNSLALIEKGWGGVLVEPSLKSFAALLALHGNNPKIKLVHSIVSGLGEIHKFWDSPDAVSTTQYDHHEVWKDVAQYSPPYYSPGITPEQLVETFSELRQTQFLNIDTEGTSVTLLYYLVPTLCKPKVICVEFDEFLDVVHDFASIHRYAVVYKSDENLVLVRE
jgi:FkbM family methyltransferase